MATEPSEEILEAVEAWGKPPFLRRVRIRGYKSIAFCDVSLQPLTILVGRNASGKSNFLDALAFLRDLMALNAHEAVKRHGSWKGIRSRFTHTDSVQVEVEVGFHSFVPRPYLDATARLSSATEAVSSLPVAEADLVGTYSVELALTNHEVPFISRESLQLRVEGMSRSFGYSSDPSFHAEINPGGLRVPLALTEGDPHRRDRLYLSGMGNQPYIDLAEGLRWLGCYNFQPDSIRRLQNPTPGSLLERDGCNVASVIETTQENEKEVIERVGNYLAAITESVELLAVTKYGDYETVRFSVARNGQGKPLVFDAASMSDGTLRTLAALVGAYQIVLPHGHASLVAIEEPETALHPAAMRALVDALDEATGRTPILLTTHSAEMLDNPTIRPENIRVVQMIDGQTAIAAVDEASVAIVRRNLNTLGGLERDNLLQPNLDDLERQELLAQSCQEGPK